MGFPAGTFSFVCVYIFFKFWVKDVPKNDRFFCGKKACELKYRPVPINSAFWQKACLPHPPIYCVIFSLSRAFRYIFSIGNSAFEKKKKEEEKLLQNQIKNRCSWAILFNPGVINVWNGLLWRLLRLKHWGHSNKSWEHPRGWNWSRKEVDNRTLSTVFLMMHNTLCTCFMLYDLKIYLHWLNIY